jgi:hypothetical protein
MLLCASAICLASNGNGTRLVIVCLPRHIYMWPFVGLREGTSYRTSMDCERQSARLPRKLSQQPKSVVKCNIQFAAFFQNWGRHCQNSQTEPSFLPTAPWNSERVSSFIYPPTCGTPAGIQFSVQTNQNMGNDWCPKIVVLI